MEDKLRALLAQTADILIKLAPDADSGSLTPQETLLSAIDFPISGMYTKTDDVSDYLRETTKLFANGFDNQHILEIFNQLNLIFKDETDISGLKNEDFFVMFSKHLLKLAARPDLMEFLKRYVYTFPNGSKVDSAQFIYQSCENIVMMVKVR